MFVKRVFGCSQNNIFTRKLKFSLKSKRPNSTCNNLNRGSLQSQEQAVKQKFTQNIQINNNNSQDILEFEKMNGKLMENVQNFRDLGDAVDGIQKGLIFRSANPTVASSKDVKFLRNDLGLKWVIDLRSPEEILEDGKDVELFWESEKWEHVRNGFTGGPEFIIYKMRNKTPSNFSPLVVHHMTLLERNKYYMAMLFKINPCTALQMIVFGVIVPEYGRQIGIQEVNKGGLSLLYEIILDTSNREIGEVMNTVLAAVRDKQPLLFNCKAGKDRTGLIAMLILSCAGATDEQIIKDYAKSDSEGGLVALGGLEKRKELSGLDYDLFSRAPAEAMDHALKYIRRKYGSVSQYLQKAGFDKQKQTELGQRLRGQI